MTLTTNGEVGEPTRRDVRHTTHPLERTTKVGDVQYRGRVRTRHCVPHARSMTTVSDLALLTLDPATGARRLGSYGEIMLGGAGLNDLLLAGRLEVTGEGKKARVLVVDQTPVGIAYLDQALARLSWQRKPRRAADSVTRLGKKLPRAAYEALAGDGVLEARSAKVLGLFPTTRYAVRPEARRDELADGVRAVLLGEREPDERLGPLAALLGAGGQVKRVVPKGRRREAAKRAKALTEGVWASEAVRAAVKASEDAVMVAVMAATAASTAGGAS